MASYTLFGVPLSPFVAKVASALRYKKVEFKYVAPKSPRDFKRWNPQTGKMPVLEFEGERIYDSTLILDWLDKRIPEPPLLSSDPSIRHQQLMLEDWSDEGFYFYLMALRWTDKNTPSTLTQITADLPALLRPILKRIFARAIKPMVTAQGLGRSPDAIVVSELSKRMDAMVSQLGDQSFLFGESLSRADLALFGQCHMGLSGPTPEFNEIIGDRPSLQLWIDRMQSTTGFTG